VWIEGADASRFNGFDVRGEPLKRLGFSLDAGHPAEALKPGAKVVRIMRRSSSTWISLLGSCSG